MPDERDIVALRNWLRGRLGSELVPVYLSNDRGKTFHLNRTCWRLSRYVTRKASVTTVARGLCRHCCADPETELRRFAPTILAYAAFRILRDANRSLSVDRSPAAALRRLRRHPELLGLAQDFGLDTEVVERLVRCAAALGQEANAGHFHPSGVWADRLAATWMARSTPAGTFAPPEADGPYRLVDYKTITDVYWSWARRAMEGDLERARATFQDHVERVLEAGPSALYELPADTELPRDGYDTLEHWLADAWRIAARERFAELLQIWEARREELLSLRGDVVVVGVYRGRNDPALPARDVLDHYKPRRLGELGVWTVPAIVGHWLAEIRQEEIGTFVLLGPDAPAARRLAELAGGIFSRHATEPLSSVRGAVETARLLEATPTA